MFIKSLMNTVSVMQSLTLLKNVKMLKYIYIYPSLPGCLFSFTVELALRFSLRSCIMSACQLVMDCPFHATDKSNVACLFFAVSIQQNHHTLWCRPGEERFVPTHMK